MRRLRRPHRPLAAAVSAALLLGAGGAGGVAVATAAGAATTAGPARARAATSVTLQVHGYGHGMGMGQYGALGYALTYGWTYQQILMHYYGTLVAGGSTSIGTLSQAAVGSTGLTSDSASVTVQLTGNDGHDVIVTSGAGFTVVGSGITTPIVVAAGGGAMFQLGTGGSSPTTWSVYVNSGGGAGGACAGGASGWGSPVATGVGSPTATPAIPAPFPATAALSTDTLHLCETGRNYRGTLAGTTASSAPAAELTVNTLPLGQYIADSAPAESPGSWGSLGPIAAQGQPQGFQQTEAQVVASRSYAVADAVAGGYSAVADVCDSTACQVYPGIADENKYDDVAVADTASQVVLLPSTAVALTQYSASTGGYTKPGSGPGGFAAVPDDGDAVCTSQVCNPYHSYTATIPIAALQADFPQIGTYQSIQVVQRNGLGALGGRVLQVTLTGTAGTVTVSGTAFASDVAGSVSDQLDAPGGATYQASGIISDWFGPVGAPSGGTAGYWLQGSDGGIFAFGAAQFYGSMGGKPLNKPIVGMAAVPGGTGYWQVASDGGIFSFGSAAFYGSMGGRTLNKPVVGMAAVPGGGGYWEVASDGGMFSFGSAPFYGSMGGRRLNEPIVGMAAVPGGGGYWQVASDGGIFSFGDAPFLGSTGNLTLQQPIVAMAATPDGRGYWLLGADGGLFAYGDATYFGSLPGSGISARAVALLPTADGQGYLIVTSTGRALAYGDAPQFGDVTTAVPGYSGTVIGGATVSAG